jgi:hypothetical protein
MIYPWLDPRVSLSRYIVAFMTRLDDFYLWQCSGILIYLTPNEHFVAFEH